MARRRLFRRLVCALLGVVAPLGLAGCTPDPHPYLALQIVADRPTVLIAECARSKVSSITLDELDSTTSAASTGSPSPSPEWSVASPLSTPDPNGVKYATAAAPARIPFFERPSSWLVRRETLRTFREDATYFVHGGGTNVASLEFSVARLRELAPGTVLTAVGYRDQHVVSEAEFEEPARSDCDRG